nr:ribosomal protein S16 [Allium pallasii]UZH92730.1 ribosomal protein S16 [Allium pallasii]
MVKLCLKRCGRKQRKAEFLKEFIK